MKFLFCLAIFIFFSLTTTSQFYNTGQAPASVTWYQINTDNFQIIYPDSFYHEANRTANLLEYMYKNIPNDYDHRPEKISVILYNQSVLSNGYVAWAPRRAEWITTPPSVSYSQDWLEQLAIHEFRHIVQLNNLEQGLTKILNLVFGEAATGAVAGYLPLWFLEGDAVWAETMYSSSGRGRVSDFDKELRAIELDRKKRYSYDQSYLGSYKFFIPDYYTFGYQMVAFSKLKYNTNLWKEALNNVGRIPFVVAPFYFGLHKYSKISKKIIYINTFDSLKTLWYKNLNIDISTNNLIQYQTLHKSYTNYLHIQPIDEKIFSVRSGIDDITRFVLLNDSEEILLHTPGLYHNTRISISEKYIVWEEIVPDVRWAQRNFSVIKLFNRQSSNVKTLRQKTRWFSPHLSPGNDSLVSIEINLYNQYSLIVFDINSDSVVKNIPLNDIRSAYCPIWINRNEIAFIALDRDGKSIMKYNLTDDSKTVLFRSGFVNIDNLSVGKNLLFFSYDFEMARTIFALDLSEKEVFRVISTRHGADLPNYNSSDRFLYYSDYTLNGYRPARISFDSNQCIPVNKLQKYNHPWVTSSSLQSTFNLQESSIPQTEYSSSPYNRLLHSVTIHSWFPFYTDLNNLINLYPEIHPGISLFSQNKLSTLTSQISYYYKNHTHYIEPRFTFQGFYPVIELSALFSNKPGFFFWPDDLQKPLGLHPYYSIAIGTYLPLQLTRNKYYRYLRTDFNYRYSNRYYYTRELGISRGFNYLEVSIFASNLLKQSHRDLQPRWGQTLFVAYNWPLINPDLFTRRLIGNYSQYLPGIIRHHGIRFSISYEDHEKNHVPIINNRILPPRGYDPDMSYYRNLRSTVEYTLPLFYPDLSLGPLVFVKRIHSTLYYDAAKICYPERINNVYSISDEFFTSFGIILYAEVHFLRFFLPFQPGFRISFLPEKQKIDLGFNISLNTSGY